MEENSIFNRGVAKARIMFADASIEHRDFMKEFVRLCQDAWLQDWHESNGGNLSYRLSHEEAEFCRSHVKEEPSEWITLGVRAQSLQSELFIVTAAGSCFRNVALHPQNCLGIVEINATGDSFRGIWGFSESGRPTSEFICHFMMHAVRNAVSAGSNRVIYHSHPKNLIALSLVLPLDAREFSRAIWGSLTESILLLPQGLGVCPWLMPGSGELAETSGMLMSRFPAVVWPQHGLLVAADTLDAAFGLTHTIEKAATIYLKAEAATKVPHQVNTSTGDNIRQAAYAFGVQINEEFLA